MNTMRPELYDRRNKCCISPFLWYNQTNKSMNMQLQEMDQTTEPTPEPTPDPTVAVLQLGKEELEIRITDVHLDEEGKLVIPIEGITLKNSWRALIVQVVLGGEKIFMEMSKVNNDGYTRTSNRHFDALPEQVLLFTDGNEETPLVYDVAAGAFVS